MNNAFQAVRANMRQQPVTLSHRVTVVRLYRHSLKLLGSWAVDRGIFCDEADKIRAEFETNRDCTPATSLRLMREAEAKLSEYAHPDRYCDPYMPGGSKFMRNPPLPMNICYPDGIPDDLEGGVPSREVNPDMTTCEKGSEEGKSAVGSVLVDFTTKSMY
ncbi:hypothetical protein ScalyP_jg5905 [Parmales sp. scaly parma]|nr:hypothetical protein ScalyP_jg5905 [Parmales sp. scaly parma]